MWQDEEACGRGGGRGGDMVGCGACGRVWGHVAKVVAGCGHVTGGGSMWYGVRPIAWMGTCGRGGPCGMVRGHVAGCGVMWMGWGHVAGGGGMSQGIGAYGRGWGGDMWQGVGVCGRW